MKKLDKIKIENFKSIRNAEIELNDLNIIVGANGAGKSNFIGVFELFKNIVNKKLQIYVGKAGGVDNILHFGRKKSKEINIELLFNDKNSGYRCILEPAVNSNFIFKDEQIWELGKACCLAEEGTKEESKLDVKRNDSFDRAHLALIDELIKIVKNFKRYHFQDTTEEAAVKQSCNVDDNIELRENASNLPAMLYLLQEKQPNHLRKIEDTIKLVAPFFDKFNLQPSRLNENFIKLEWLEKGSDSYFDISALSDGTLRFICLVTLLLQPELPNIILLDEPELGLHPHAIQILAGLLRKASKKSQVIVATQSVTLLNQFDNKNIIVVDRENKQSVFKHLGNEDIQDWKDDYSLGELWEKNIFGGNPK